MRIQRAYKTELDPNDGQCRLLAQHTGAARYAYNWGLRRRMDEYKRTGESTSAYTQQKQFAQHKREAGNEWTYEVSNFVFQSALQDLDKAYANFFRRVKRGGEKPGFPRFKKRRTGQGSFRVYGSIHVEPRRVKLPKIGWVRLKERGYLPVGAKPISTTVTQRVGRWFVSVQVDEEVQVEVATGDAVGVDLGLKTLAVASDGRTWESPKALRQHERKLACLQRKLARQTKGSKRRERTKQKVGRLHYKIACIRAHTTHQVTHDLVRPEQEARQRPEAIVVEDLRVRNMMQNRHLSKAISDAAWQEIRRQLEYKATWNGSEVLVADAFFPSTQKCPECGAVKAGDEKLDLSEREYVCADCGCVIDRDLGAAISLQHLAGKAPERENACGGVHVLAESEAPVKREAVMATVAPADAGQSSGRGGDAGLLEAGAGVGPTRARAVGVGANEKDSAPRVGGLLVGLCPGLGGMNYAS